MPTNNKRPASPSSARAELVEGLRSDAAYLRRVSPTGASAFADRMEDAATALSAREGEIYERCAAICDEIDNNSGGGFHAFAEAIRAAGRRT